MQPDRCEHGNLAPGSTCPACRARAPGHPPAPKPAAPGAGAYTDPDITRTGGLTSGGELAFGVRPGTADEAFPFDPSDKTSAPPGGAHPPGTGVGTTGWRSGPLSVGQDFGSRYHIIKLLGAGGMGAVYQAWDAELSVPVAVKVIRPEIAADPKAAEDLERRFKRELLLARQVTHKNVVRIHDLGEIDGIKYITMPYIQGRDLATVLMREGRVPAARAVPLARQIAAGLAAAHESGIVHRDLKPANIMVDDEGQAVIMDFGIARSAVTTSQTAGVVGTLAYMAPEQAMGQAVDGRADIYAFGLILRDLLAGPRELAGGGTAVAELMQRMQQAPPSPRTIDGTIPEALDAIVARCLEPDPAHRYQTSAELAADLARVDSHGQRVERMPPARPRRVRLPRRRTALVLAAAAVVSIAVVAGLRVWTPGAPAAPVESVSLAVVPFRNASGDSTLDGLGVSLAEILRAELGQSAYLRTVPSELLRQVLRDLRLAPESDFDTQTLRRLGEFSNAQTIVWGQYLKIGDQVQVLATLHDLRDNGGSTTLKADPADPSALFGAVRSLAAQVRQRLAGSPEILKELDAASLKPSSQSLEALRYYQEGLDFVRQGNQSEAITRFTLATQEDAGFALAYAKLAQANAALGHDADAERFSRKAVELTGGLAPQERYLIEAIHARIRNDMPAAVAAYEDLARVSPNDPTILFELGSLYENSGALQKAQEAYGRTLEHDPRSVDTLLANGRILIRLQKPAEALDYLNRALSLAIQLSYEVSHANVLHALGVAYSRLEKPEDALRYLRESIEIKRRLAQKSGIAASLNEAAQIHVRLGQHAQALSSFTEALTLRREIGDKRGIGRVLINLASLQNDTGQPDVALASLREALQIEREVGDEQLVGLCLNFIGSIYFAKGQFEDAVTYFERALPIREKVNVPGETADTLHNLAEAALKTGQYERATAEYLRALQLRRKTGDARGAAIESYSMGTLFEQQGRFGAAMKAKEEALTTFRTLKDRSFWAAEILRGYGSALAQAGQMEEAKPLLDEALTLARELRNPALVAQSLAAEADRLYYLGNANAARAAYAGAMREAEGAPDRSLALMIAVNAARAGLETEPPAAMLNRLARLQREAEGTGLKYLAIECALHRARVYTLQRDWPSARKQLEGVVARSENLGLRMQAAQGHHLLAKVLGSQGDAAEARRHYAAAQRLLDQMRREEGGADVVKRADLTTVYADSVGSAAER